MRSLEEQNDCFDVGEMMRYVALYCVTGVPSDGAHNHKNKVKSESIIHYR